MGTRHARSSRKRQGPHICVDEHILRPIADVFRKRFSVIEAARSNEFSGRDERDYLPTLNQRNTIFVTSDSEFVEDVIDNNLEHAGIVYIPPGMLPDERMLFAEIAAVWIDGATRTSPTAHRGVTLYPGSDGVRFFRRHGTHDKRACRTHLGISWHEIAEDL